MNISEKKKSELYNAIHEPNMDLRIRLKQTPSQSVDSALFYLNLNTWKKVCKVLNIKDN